MLRDYLTANYYLPLWAGIRGATTAPPGTYNPGSQIGSGLPGGIGAGDGGFDTPADASIDTPTLIYPSVAAGLDLPVCAIMASSAFSATGGQTHIASRWIIELMGVSGPVGYVYDSGADSELLTNLPIASLGLQNGADFRVAVRYKGSDGGWSAWGTQTFTRTECDDTCSIVENFTASFASDTLTTHPFTLTIPEAYKHWQNVKVYLVAGSQWDDRGSITGNVTTINPTHTPPAVVVYAGPDVLIAEGTDDDITGTIENTIPGGCSYSLNLRFASEDPESDCPSEEPPPAPPPGPVFPPPPPPPPPPPAPAPDTPAGQAQIGIDWANSYVRVNEGCSFVYKFPELDRLGGTVTTGGHIDIGLTVQNLSPTTGGTVWAALTADNTNVQFGPTSTQTVAVNAGGYTTVTWRAYTGGGFVALGTYTFTITTASGVVKTFKVIMVPLTDCNANGGDTGA